MARGRALKGTARGVIVARRFWREGGSLDRRRQRCLQLIRRRFRIGSTGGEISIWPQFTKIQRSQARWRRLKLNVQF